MNTIYKQETDVDSTSVSFSAVKNPGAEAPGKLYLSFILIMHCHRKGS